MVAQQLSLNLGELEDLACNDKPKISKPKRFRYKMPTYIKFYTLYQYDRKKFTKLMKIWLETEEGQKRTLKTLKDKQDEVLELCYIRDEKGLPLRDCDEKYIMSIHRLHHEQYCSTFKANSGKGIHELLYEELMQQGLINIFEEQEIINIDGKEIVTYKEDRQAEIKDTWRLPIKKRIIIHLGLLRTLRKMRKDTNGN